ncbi:hypothetical protein ACJJTC_007452 [Scirpophaga incertulas]
MSYIDEDAIKPTPAEFDRFVPWACSQLQVEKVVVVTKIKQVEYVSSSGASERTKSKLKPKVKQASKAELSSRLDVDTVSSYYTASTNIVNIHAVYDTSDNLVQIKFEKGIAVPRAVIKIIALTIPYHNYLTSVSMNNRIDQYTIYELCKFLPLSYITDLCLDGVYIKDANYNIVLEQRNYIKHFSLSRCSIDDNILEALAKNLTHPLPASKSLSILNLSTNRITDEGVKFLAEALRSNRQLSYLNLADNMVTDLGADYILNIMKEFQLDDSELKESKTRRFTYLKEKNELTLRIAKDLQSDEIEQRSVKKKPAKAILGSKKNKIEKEHSLKSVIESKTTDVYEFLEKAASIAENTIGEFNDPFSQANRFVRDGIVYCFGNNTLCYLNLAYNNVTYATVKKLLEVLMYQRNVDKKPRGLTNVSLEGNYIPAFCRELTTIEQILSDCLYSMRSFSSQKKRPQSRNK